MGKQRKNNDKTLKELMIPFMSKSQCETYTILSKVVACPLTSGFGDFQELKGTQCYSIPGHFEQFHPQTVKPVWGWPLPES